MAVLISYVFKQVLILLVSEYFRYALGVAGVMGLLGLVYSLTGKAK